MSIQARPRPPTFRSALLPLLPCSVQVLLLLLLADPVVYRDASLAERWLFRSVRQAFPSMLNLDLPFPLS
jgi:hypothetical protein